METLDQVRIQFAPGQLGLLNVCLAFLMFGVALDLSLDAFRQLYHRPRGPLLGLLSQWVVLPALTLGLILLMRPAPSLALGMVLVAACPGGNVSNYMVHLARGNAALSVSLTTLSTLACAVATPLYFAALAPLLPGARPLIRDIHISLGDMVLTVMQLVLIPLVLGMVLRARFPDLTERLRRPVRALSLLIFLGFILVALYVNRNHLLPYLSLVFLLVFLHNGIALLAGYRLARVGGLPRRDARAISIETGIQNSGLGLVLIFNFFDGLGGMALIAAWWGIWHLISGLAMAWWWNRATPPE